MCDNARRKKDKRECGVMGIVHIFMTIDAIGTAAFAISGAMVAIKKGNDIFGIILLAIVTALGGGMTRDIILGHTPPRLFDNGIGLTIAVACALLCFFVVRRNYRHRDWHDSLDRFINDADALGLGSFAVTGCQVALYSGFGSNPFLCIAMGMLTGAGGGMLRDIILNDMPFILVKHIYASAAMVGAGLYYVLFYFWPHHEPLPTIIAILATFILRLCASRYRWKLPKAR